MNWDLVREIVRLRLRRTMADQANLIWLFLMPLVFAFFMGFLMGDWNPGPAQRPAFLVSDADDGEASRRLLAPLDGSPRIRAGARGHRRDRGPSAAAGRERRPPGRPADRAGVR